MSQDKEMKSAEEIEHINHVRASIYSFLSRAFKKEIDIDFLDNIVAAGPTISLLAESQEGVDLIEGSKRLGQFIRHTVELSDDGKQDLLRQLRFEFKAIFVGIGDDSVQLVESAYLKEKNLRFEKPTQDVQAAYQSLGFKKDNEFCEPEDHLALEFEFMAQICNWTGQALRTKDIGNAIAYLSLQKEFLRDHIVRWAPRMCERLKQKAKSDFYSSIAYLTNGFVEMDDKIPDHLTTILKNKFSESAVR